MATADLFKQPYLRRAPVVIDVQYRTLRDFLCACEESTLQPSIFLQTERPLAFHSLVELTIHLPNGPQLEVVGRVARVFDGALVVASGHQPGMSIEIVEYHGDSERQLKHFFRRLSGASVSN